VSLSMESGTPVASTGEEEFEVSLPKGRNITPPERPVSREVTAATIAKIIVWTFTISIGCCFLVVFAEVIFCIIKADGKLESSSLAASFELFKTVSAIMSGPLGFVLGFYFRDRGQD
jgi:hypothetical protein